MEPLILSAETVLPISNKPIERGAVLIHEGKIKEVGKKEDIVRRNPSVEHIPLGRGLLLPGLVNAHVHLELGWIKEEIGEFGSFAEWIELMIMAKRRRPDPKSARQSAKEGAMELVEGGVTTVGEISSYEGEDIEPIKEAGLRCVLYRELFDRHGNFWDANFFEGDELIDVRPFPHAPYSCSPEFLDKVASFSRATGKPIGIHLAESIDEVRFIKSEPNEFEERVFPLIGRKPFKRGSNETPYGYLKDMGFFDRNRVTLVHMVYTSNNDARDIASRDIGVVLCPRSNFYLNVGTPPFKLLLSLNRVGIGTDGLSSNHNLDIFEELRFLHLISRKVLNKSIPYTCVYLATLGGARALFLENKIGSIEEGKEADLVFITPRWKTSDPYMSVISSKRDDVALVICRGRVLYSKIGNIF